MAAFFYIYSNYFLFSVGDEILMWVVMYFWEGLHFCCIRLYLWKRCFIMNSVCLISVCILIGFVHKYEYKSPTIVHTKHSEN